MGDLSESRTLGSQLPTTGRYRSSQKQKRGRQKSRIGGRETPSVKLSEERRSARREERNRADRAVGEGEERSSANDTLPKIKLINGRDLPDLSKLTDHDLSKPIVVTTPNQQPFKLQLTEALYLRDAEGTFVSINIKEQGTWPVGGEELIVIGDYDAPHFAFSVPTINQEAPRKRYHWRVLPQGMKNSPTICQWYVASLLSPVSTAVDQAILHHYMDDVLVCTPSDDALTHALDLTIYAVIAEGFELQEEKVQRMPLWKYLGLEIMEGTSRKRKRDGKDPLSIIEGVFPSHHWSKRMTWLQELVAKLIRKARIIKRMLLNLISTTTHSPSVNRIHLSPEGSPEEEGLELEEVQEWTPDDERNPAEEDYGLVYPTQHHWLWLSEGLDLRDANWTSISVTTKEQGAWPAVEGEFIITGDCKHTPQEIEILPATLVNNPESLVLWLRCTHPPTYLPKGQITSQMIPTTWGPNNKQEVPVVCPVQAITEERPQVASTDKAIIHHYMDDVLVCAPNNDVLSHALDLAIDALIAAGFKLQENKVQQMPPWRHLGLEIGKRTIVPQKLEIKLISSATHSPTANRVVVPSAPDMEEGMELKGDSEEDKNPDEEEHQRGWPTQQEWFTELLRLSSGLHLRDGDWTFISVDPAEQDTWPRIHAAEKANIHHYMDDVLVCAPNDDVLSHVLDLTIDALIAAGFELQVQRMPPWKYFRLEIGKRTIVPQKLAIKAFSFTGIPKELKTDNGLAYKSREFCNFLQQRGVEHKISIPHSPTVKPWWKGPTGTSKGSLASNSKC
ncbi:hypothetical protein DUI87_06638 [Hirundo rustica rustica]|uniref:ribonuclease H n=1 Tax=Hirundo rustica rustica TaxID=333673 RepID=A0A3M0KU07_HIRRU|nr:hypothetical protein DUI87_06638 [Hirundo rustica rustica]